ncbi:MAG: hypothetical protein EOM52_00710 [Clostridia bacterium]|nr:hypothetical protein [Clostridia bacterium]
MERYEIAEKLVPLDGRTAAASNTNLVTVYSTADVESGLLPELLAETPLLKYQSSSSCKAEVFPDYICGSFSIPKHGNHPHRDSFSYCIRAEGLYFLDDTNTVSPILADISQNRAVRKASVGHLVFLFLESLILNDSRYLQAVYDRMGYLEEQILAGTLENVNQKLSPYRRELLTLYRFYDQLGDLAQVLQINENGFFSHDTISLFRLFSERTDRLLDQTSMLRDYCMQIREVYQSEIDVKQNRIMKVLTVVTTVFSPLTIIVGWYGMNFSNMPELSWAYGYPAVIALSALSILLCLWIFKKKKFL